MRVSIEYGSLGRNRHRTIAAVMSDRVQGASSTNGFEFAFDRREAEAMRWYAEDYLANPNRADRALAAQVSDFLERSGAWLAAQVFGGLDERLLRSAGKQSWEVEIHDLTGDATQLPW